jgi:hypothetical protein
MGFGALFINVEDLPHTTAGGFQLLFLFVVYGYILFAVRQYFPSVVLGPTALNGGVSNRRPRPS